MLLAIRLFLITGTAICCSIVIVGLTFVVRVPLRVLVPESMLVTPSFCRFVSQGLFLQFNRLEEDNINIIAKLPAVENIGLRGSGITELPRTFTVRARAIS